jgi:hypothetical protein
MEGMKSWLLATIAGLSVAVPYALSFVRYYTEVLGYYPSCVYGSSALVVLSFLVSFGLTCVVISEIEEKKSGTKLN